MGPRTGDWASRSWWLSGRVALVGLAAGAVWLTGVPVPATSAGVATAVTGAPAIGGSRDEVVAPQQAVPAPTDPAIEPAWSAAAQTPWSWSAAPRLVPGRGAGLTSVPVGALRSNVRGRHTVTVVPMALRGKPDLARMRAIAEDTARFWAREVPGLTFSFRFLKPVALPRRACVYDVAAPRAAAAAGVRLLGGVLAQLAPRRHVLAWAPDCPPSGQGELRDGRGLLFAGGLEASTVAHELGHNLGLNHANLLECSAGGQRVPLSSRCREMEYGDTYDVMGAGVNGEELLADKRLSALGQVLFGGRLARIRGTGVTSIAVPGVGMPVAAGLRSRFGLLLLDAAPVGGEPLDTAGESPAGLHVRVATRPCPQLSVCGLMSGLLRLPEWSGRLGDPVLELGDAVELPGTGKRLVVTQVGERRVEVNVVPPGSGSAPPPPVVATPDGVAQNLPWTLSWAASAGAVAYVVEVGGVVVARVPSSQTQARLPAPRDLVTADGDYLDLDRPLSVTVTAVSATGQRASSSPASVPLVYPRLVVTSDREPGPSSGPVTLSWATVPVSVGDSITDWLVEINGVTSTKPAAVRSLTFDPASVPDDGFGAFYVSVTVTGRDADGGTVVEGFWNGDWYLPPPEPAP